MTSIYAKIRKEKEMNENKKSVLSLNYIGKDDFSQPIYKDQFGKLWKDLGMGESEVPCLYSVTNNDWDGEPLSPIKQEYVFSSEPYRVNRYKFEYMLLGRMRMDCEYYLGYGNRSLAILSNGSVKEHIGRMKELWNIFPEDQKPEWLTWEQILTYEKEMAKA